MVELNFYRRNRNNVMISVLYVDDEPDLLEIGKIFLEKSGRLQVDIVNSAYEGLQKIRMNPYDP